MRKNVLITGATGFVGSHLADYVLENHPDTKIYATKRYHLSRMDHVRHIEQDITWVDCNLTDPIAVSRMFDSIAPEVIFHCAAESFVSPSWNHPLHYMRVNYDSTVNLLEGLRTANSMVPFHIPGSGEEYGEVSEQDLPITPETKLQPVNPYAVSKIAQDLIGYVYHKSYGLNVIRTRAFNHEGPRREKVFGIPSYASQIASIEAGLLPPIIKTGHIDDKRNFTHVKDMVRAYWKATELCEPGKLYLVGSDSDEMIFTFREALEKLIARSEVANITYEETPEFVRPTNVPFLISDISEFSEVTGWAPQLSFDDILDDTLGYWRDMIGKG
ncbi:GDP-mannose 4,6-dehydratase [Litoricolaceae bacterium]|nr:GDP-mannose 4,6-dehydratase [Litorivicinaceae bacterium]